MSDYTAFHPSAIQRFIKNINKSPDINICWEWKACCIKKGYGLLSVCGKPKLTHRFAYEMIFGPIPKGLCVCHHCDNPPCCNPYHLFLGTNADNVQDSVNKNRRFIKFTREDVKEIICLRGKIQQKEISTIFNISIKHIRDIQKGTRRKYMKIANNKPKNLSEKLSAEEVKQIRYLHKNKHYTYYELAKIFNVSFSNIGNIVRENTWKHVK